MTVAAPFPLPPGRALTAWRRELAPFRPRRLWLVHLLLHRVECLVRVSRRQPLDALAAALLRQIEAGTPTDRLGLEPDLYGRCARDLAAEGLVDAAGRLTERGRAALRERAYPVSAEERRVFTFAESEAPGEPPHFVPLRGPAVPRTPPAGWQFDPAVVAACVARSDEWKARHGFPADVEAVPAPTAADWRRVLFDRPEELLLVFVPEGEGEAARRLGFAVRAEDWILQTQAPALTLAPRPDDFLPEMGVEPAPETWQEAWREWVRRRGLTSANAGPVEQAEDRVRATLPPAEAARLGGERTDAWLIAGTGRTRTAAPLEITAGAG